MSISPHTRSKCCSLLAVNKALLCRSTLECISARSFDFSSRIGEDKKSRPGSLNLGLLGILSEEGLGMD